QLCVFLEDLAVFFQDIILDRNVLLEVADFLVQFGYGIAGDVWEFVEFGLGFEYLAV
ncbi:hypothetical protein FBU59_004249, partial [Linderina macrospora]